MKLKSIVFYFGSLILGSAACLLIATIISTSISNTMLNKITSDMESSSESFAQVVLVKDKISHIEASVIPLIVEKDIDILETKLADFSKAKKATEEAIAACSSCGEFANSFQEYENKLNTLEKDKILLGKTAEAIDFYLSEVSTSYSKTVALINSTQSRHQEELKAAIKYSQDQKSKLIFYLVITGLIGLIINFILGVPAAIKVRHSLSQAVSAIITASTQLKSTSLNLAGDSESLSKNATGGAASLEETVATLEVLNSIVVKNTEGAKAGAQLAEESLSKTSEGQKAIKELIGSINSLSENSKKINEILVVIDDIAFQTNLLALNAAVEAARAGEQGKGFSIVAEAVRSLAHRSASAAKEIANLITEQNNKTDVSVTNAERSDQIFTNILAQISKLTAISNEISAGSIEQAEGIKQISLALGHLDQVSQNNAKTAEGTAESAKVLKAETESLAMSLRNLEELSG